jgi:hypothetical protein
MIVKTIKGIALIVKVKIGFLLYVYVKRVIFPYDMDNFIEDCIFSDCG